jgi:glycerate kinase
MKIVIAPDSFKESLSAIEVCKAIERGLKKVCPKAKIVSIPMADGGEGTLDALQYAQAGTFKTYSVTSPIGEKIKARYLVLGKTAVIEMAQASGLVLVPPHQRNPLETTSYGTGELIAHALEAKYEKIILGLGGVATNDGGVGMAQALGFRFLDAHHKEIPWGAKGLLSLVRIDTKQIHPRLKKTKFIALTDVKNPLCGVHGSARVYGPQKGATPKMIPQIEKALKHLAHCIQKDLGVSVLKQAGAGAAGGSGAGAMAFLNAEIQGGIDWILEQTHLEQAIKQAHYVITGEGKIDGQTLYGKTVLGVAQCAKKYQIPVIALCGTLGHKIEKLYAYGIKKIVPIAPPTLPKQESIQKASRLLEESASALAGELV